MGNEPFAERLREQGMGAARERSRGVRGHRGDAALLYTLLLLILFSNVGGKSSVLSKRYIYLCIYILIYTW